MHYVAIMSNRYQMHDLGVKAWMLAVQSKRVRWLACLHELNSSRIGSDAHEA